MPKAYSSRRRKARPARRTTFEPSVRSSNRPGRSWMETLVDNAQQLAAATRAACGALGLELFAPANPSGAITAIKAPKGLDSGVIVREFRQKFGSIVADGQGEMKGQLFRIAHLGYFD